MYIYIYIILIIFLTPMESLLLLTSKIRCSTPLLLFRFVRVPFTIYIRTYMIVLCTYRRIHMWQCVLKAWLIHACCALHEPRRACVCASVCMCVCVGSRVAEHVFNRINITFFYITKKSCLVLCVFALVR